MQTVRAPRRPSTARAGGLALAGAATATLRGMAQTADRRASHLAGRQLGLITRQQALHRARLTPAQVRARLSSGRWRRDRPGVYALEGHPPSWEQAVLSAVLATAGAVAARRTALWLLGARRHLERPDVIELLTTQTRVLAVAGCAVRTTRGLPVAHRTRAGRVPCTSAARTIADLVALAGGPPARHLLAWTEELVALGCTTAGEVHAVATAQRRGRFRLLDELIALTGPEGPTRFRSWLEAEGARLFDAAGLPPARWNVPVDGIRGLADAVWADERVVVELDGLAFHRSPGQQRADRRRDRRLQLGGWTVLRFTWHDVVERPDEVVADVRAALQRQRPAAGQAAATTTQ